MLATHLTNRLFYTLVRLLAAVVLTHTPLPATPVLCLCLLATLDFSALQFLLKALKEVAIIKVAIFPGTKLLNKDSTKFGSTVGSEQTITSIAVAAFAAAGRRRRRAARRCSRRRGRRR